MLLSSSAQISEILGIKSSSGVPCKLGHFYLEDVSFGLFIFAYIYCLSSSILYTKNIPRGSVETRSLFI